MDHVLKALDEHIAHQDWLLKCKDRELEDMTKERDALKSEVKNLSERLAVTISQRDYFQKELYPGEQNTSSVAARSEDRNDAKEG